MKFKKIISLALAIFIIFINIVPTTHATQRWFVSSLDKTFFEIPKDDRNFEDFVFTNQVFKYKNWKDNEDNWVSQEAKITANMIWYNYYFSPILKRNGIATVTSQELSTFFVVVNNHYYNTEGQFAFPIMNDNNMQIYMYMYWKKDEHEDTCLYLDLENKGEKTFKIQHTCGFKFLDRDPFLLFFQIERTGYDKTAFDKNLKTYFTSNLDDLPRYKISVTTTQNVQQEGKKYVNFYKPENFYIDEEELVKTTKPIIQDSLLLVFEDKGEKNYINLYNSYKSKNFLRKGNQRAFRPYSFLFENDYNNELLKLKENATGDMSKYRNVCWTGTNEYNCQLTFPVEPTSWFETFIFSVAEQYYSTPAITNDNTYIEVPDPIKGEGFQPMEYENCDSLAIGCHISNLGKTFYNTVGKFFSNVWDGFGNVVKNTINWIGDTVIKLPPIKWIIDTFHPFLKVLYDYFMSYFTPIWDIFTGKTNLQDIIWGDQEYICTKEPSNFIIESTTPAGKKPMEALGAFIYFINPLPPPEGAEICTGLGMKRIEYGKDTILDVFLFNIFVFAGIWFAFIGLRRYN